MACSCKSGGANKQVTSVKQVTKKPSSSTVMVQNAPQRKPLNKKRLILKRPM
jgi:hypothetical protein